LRAASTSSSTDTGTSDLSTPLTRTPIECGVTYWAPDVGPYIWHEFSAERTAADLRQISLLGHGIVRVQLAWDVFMPSPTSVDPSHLRDLERLLSIAESESLRVVPALFVQSIGDCVLLPPFAIDVDRARRGVRVVTGGVTQPGGPRDMYTDPLMLEAQLTWLDRLLSEFGGHSAIAWWDLGFDPAATIRPQRITHLGDWAATVTKPLRDRGYRSALTLGADDIVTARGVRLAVVAGIVDIFGIAIDPMLLPLDDPAAVDSTLFMMQLAQRLSGVNDVHAHIGMCERDEGDTTMARCADADAAGTYADHAVNELASAGAAGLIALQWSCAGPRVRRSPPFDRVHRLSRRGVVDASREPTRFGVSWSREIRREREVRAASPWPPKLEVESFYSNLPDSVQDLHVAWKREQRHDPAMLE
jgi:hypothetical protein